MPFDALGNYIPGDDKPSIDEMKYELAKKEERRKAATMSDLLDRYISDPIRGVSTAGSEVIKRLPGADLAQAAMSLGSGIFAMPASVPYAIGKEIASGNFGEAAGKQVAGKAFEDAMRDLTYEPRTQGGRDIMEGIAKAIEVSKLPPYIGHIYAPRAPISANDVRVLGKRAIETGREVAAIPEDFLMAQQGLKRESNLGGTTYGAAMGDVARNVEDVTVGNYQRAKVRQAAQNAPEDTVYDPLRQRREQASVEVYNVPEGAVPYYAVKPTGGQLVKAVDPVTGQLREVPDSSVAGISDVYENIRKQTDGQGLINQYLRTFVNRPGVQDIWNDFNAKKVQEEFPKAPTPDDARDAFQVKYPTAKDRNNRMIQFFDEFAASPEAQAAAADLGIKIPTFEDYQKRIEAANTWAQKSLTNYVQKFVGTKEDPALQLATQGITFKSPERLVESAADALNYASPTELRKQREAAGFKPEGEIQPFLKEKLTELKAVDAQLREMVAERNSIQEQARADNVNPETLPAFDSIRRQIRDKTAEKERLTQQAENYKLGKAYETLADLAIEPRSVKDLNRKLTFAEKQFFPYLDKTPEDATLYDVDPKLMERIGLTDMATMFMDDIVSGKIPVEQIGNISIPKYVQEYANARMAKELAIKKDAKLREQKFNTYLEEQVQQIPTTMHFDNAAVLELTNAMGKDDLVRHMSTDTAILDHCVGQGGRGSNGKQYIPIVDPVTGEVPKGSSGQPTVYVGNILKRGDIIASVRDLVTGRTIGNVEFNKTADGEYDIHYASGYQNGRMDPQYTEALKNYLNSKAEVIRGSGDKLTKNGIVDQEAMRRSDLRDITGLSDGALEQLSYDGLPRFLSREDIVELNNQRKAMLPSAQLNSEVATLNNAYADLLDENQQLNFSLQNADNDLVREELMERRAEIQSELQNIGTRIGNMPLEEISTIAREMINDAFPEDKKTARARLQYLDNQSPISLRIQPRIFETIRDILRDERDAVGAPLSPQQQSAVRENWYALSDTIARSVNGDTYNAAAIANNIRRNPESYNLGEYNAQMINAIAEMIEQQGIQDPALTTMPRIDRTQSNLPERVIEHINSMLSRAITSDRTNQNAIQAFRDAQFTVSNPRPNTIYSDLPQHLRNEAIGELQRGIEELERRAQLPVLRNTAPTLEGVRNAVAERTRPGAQQQDLAIIIDRMPTLLAEDYGQPVADYVWEAMSTIRYNVNEDAPLYIESVRRMADDEDEQPVRAAFNMIADRLVEAVRANTAAARNTAEQLPAVQENGGLTPEYMTYLRTRLADARTGDDMVALERDFLQVGNPQGYSPAQIQAIEREIGRRSLEVLRDNQPAFTPPNTNVGNVVQNLINQYPERNQIQALINDLEHGEYSELPTALLNADEIVVDDTVSQIIEQLEEYRDSIPANQETLLTGPQVADIVNRELDRQSDIRNLNRESLRSFRNDMTDVTDFDDPQDMINTLVSLRAQYDDAGREGLSNAVGTILTQIDAQVRSNRQRGQIVDEEPNRRRLPAEAQDRFAEFDGRMNQTQARNRVEEILNDDTIDEADIRALRDMINDPDHPQFRSGDMDYINELNDLIDYRLGEDTRIVDEEPRAALPAPEVRPNIRYGTDVRAAFNGIFADNNEFSTPDSLDALRALPQLIRRPGATRNSLGIGQFDTEQANELATHFELLREQRLREFGIEGRKAGGYIQSSKNRLLSPNTDEMRLALLKGK